MFSGELVGGRGVLYYCIDGWYVSKRGVYIGALVIGAWRARECCKRCSVAMELATSIGSSGWGWLVVTRVQEFGAIALLFGVMPFSGT